MVQWSAFWGPLNLIASWDAALFQIINSRTQNGFFDLIMPVLSDFHLWRWPLGAGILAMIIFGNRKARITAVFIIVAVALSDQISSGLLKPLVARPRPSHQLDGVRLIAGKGGHYGFPSSHAANIFAVWAVIGSQYRKLTPYLFIIPLGVAYSRIYLGVHYPLDVFGGAVLGAIIALAVVNAGRYLGDRVPRIRNARKRFSGEEREKR
jgi:undecaprenyl-diphosphatase